MGRYGDTERSAYVPKATADEIIAGTRDDVFVTPKALFDAGIVSPDYVPPNAAVFEAVSFAGYFTSDTGYYSLNGGPAITSGSTSPYTTGTVIVAPCDASGAHVPSGVLTWIDVGTYWFGAITGVTHLPPGVQTFMCGGQPGIATLPALPVSLITLFCPNCNLSEAELNEAMIDLGATSIGGTADVSSNPGSATCNTSPATANGWTVTT